MYLLKFDGYDETLCEAIADFIHLKKKPLTKKHVRRATARGGNRL